MQRWRSGSEEPRRKWEEGPEQKDWGRPRCWVETRVRAHPEPAKSASGRKRRDNERGERGMECRETGGRGGHRTRTKRICIYSGLPADTEAEEGSCPRSHGRQRIELWEES